LSGSKAAIIEANLPLLDALEESGDGELSGFIKQEKIKWKKEIEWNRQFEMKIGRMVFERFE
jgi:hypothetical protein